MASQQMMVGQGFVSALLNTRTITGLEWGEPNPVPPPATIYNSGSATLNLHANGLARGTYTNDLGNTLANNFAGEWKVSGAASQFEARATISSGTVNSGSATGSWINLGSDVSWTKSYAGTGSQSVVLVVEIRNAVTTAVLTTATVTLTVSR